MLAPLAGLSAAWRTHVQGDMLANGSSPSKGCAKLRWKLKPVSAMRRTFQDVEEAAKPGGMLAQGGAHPLTVPQAFSLRHRRDLLEDLPEKDVQEMRAVVLDILSSIAGESLPQHC